MLALSRPEPAMPSFYFWTWHRSWNWMLDGPGIWGAGCAKEYLKRPETLLEDYRRLTDLAAGIGIKGITIFGFLRDSHGDIEYAKRAAELAGRALCQSSGRHTCGIGWSAWPTTGSRSTTPASIGNCRAAVECTLAF